MNGSSKIRGRMQYEENYSSATDTVDISWEDEPVKLTTDSSWEDEPVKLTTDSSILNTFGQLHISNME